MRVEELLKSAIAEGVFPGCAFAYGDAEKHRSGYVGRQMYHPESKAIDENSLWDLASVSKVVATTSAAMLLHDDGLLNLGMPIADILPAFGQQNKGHVTVKNLMVHDSGLIAFRPYHQKLTEPVQVWDAVCKEKLTYPTGSKSIYSDLSMITMAKLIETISNKPFEQVVHERVFAPLGMMKTGYNPGLMNPDAVPTEPVEPWREALRRRRLGDLRLKEIKETHPSPDGQYWIKGEVHDPSATVLGGIAGHAGLYSTLDDLVRFAKVLVAGGSPIFGKETFALFTRRQEEKSTRALGWDTKSPEGSSAGSMFGARSFGHTGFTGTCLWVDPDRKFFAILLGNRVHPSASNLKISQLRPKFHDLIWSESY